ncbi:MAG: radical SAM protein [Acidobacteria bacterium]|nr:MAG: radical SAM protein [Acidobacteriota bacterium]
MAGNAPGVGVYRNRASDYAPAPGFPDLDELPWPDCDIPGIEEYFTHSARGRDVRSSALVTSRGCPFDCEFCSVHPVCGRKWRARGAENVLGEIAFLNQDYGVRYFEIEDDNFTLDSSRAHLILEGIVRLNEKGAGISWAAPNGLRIDTLDARLLRLVRQSACVDIALALEHADPEMLRIMNKKLDPEKAFRVVSECVELGLPHVTLLVIVGYPGETAERFETCRQFLKRVCRLGGRVDIYAGLAQPYPGTRLLERCRREGWLVHPDVADFHAFPHLMSTSWTVNIVTADFDEREARRRREVLTSLPDSPGRKLVKAILPDAGLRLLRRCRRQMGI